MLFGPANQHKGGGEGGRKVAKATQNIFVTLFGPAKICRLEHQFVHVCGCANGYTVFCVCLIRVRAEERERVLGFCKL